MESCVNCGAPLTGAYCADCGQKRFVESDRRLSHLLGEIVAGATELDGRIWRSIRALLFRPGLLSREYFEGRRARWISPISLFFAASVVYFVAPLHGGDVTLQFDQQVAGRVRQLARAPDQPPLTPRQLASEGQFHSRFTSPWVDAYVARRDAELRAATNGVAGYGYRDVRAAYDAKADDVSKTLVFLHLPLAALVLSLLFARSRRYYAEHVVFAMHYLAFYIVLLQAVVQFDALVAWSSHGALRIPGGALDGFMRGALVLYAVLALRRAYALGVLAAIGATAVMLAGLVAANIYVYRPLQFVVTFWLTTRG